MIIEEQLEDSELAELEDCDALAPLYHVKGIGLHITLILTSRKFRRTILAPE